MGYSFWILIHDGYEGGLHLKNPRMFIDERGNNSFSYTSKKEMSNKALKILQENGIENFKVITSDDKVISNKLHLERLYKTTLKY